MAEGDFLSAADLLNFNKQVQGNSLPGIASQAIGSWAPDMTTWSPVSQGLGSFGKTFLSALLGNYARQDASDQLSKVVSVLPQLGASPNSVAVPEGVDADAFNVLKGKAALGDMMASVLGKQQKEVAKNKVLGELEAYGYKPPTTITEGGTGGAQGTKIEEIPGTPQFEAAQKKNQASLKIEEEARGVLKNSPVAQNYQIRNSSMQNILANLKNDSVYGDLALVNGFQKIQDPEGSVREGDVQTIQGAQDRLSKFYGDTKGWFTSEGRLKPEYRKKLAETAANTVNSYGKVYQKYADDYLGLVDRSGGSRANIPFIPHNDIDINKYMGSDKYSIDQLKAAGYDDNDISELKKQGLVE